MTRGAPGTPGRVVEYFDRLYAGTVTGTANTGAALTAEHLEIFQVLVRADPNNTGRVLIGNEWQQPFPLDPGDSVTIPIDDPRKVAVYFQADGDEVTWLAMG